MLNTELIREADFLAGGFPAQYGNRLSSVLNIALREGNREKFAGDFEVGISGAGLALEGPINEHGSWMATARRSYLDFIARPAGITALPKFGSYQAKAVSELGSNNRLWFVSIGGKDNIHYEGDQEDNPTFIDLQTGGWRTVSGLNWQSLWGKNGYGILSMSDAINVYESDAYDIQLQNQLIYQNHSSEGETTLKYDLVYKLEDVGDLCAGAVGKRLRSSLEVKHPLVSYKCNACRRSKDILGHGTRV